MKRFLFVVFALFVGQNVLNATFHRAVVHLSVADLRREPVDVSLATLLDLHETNPARYAHVPSIFNADNPLQETQLLFGEHVFIERYNDEWVRVIALEQPVYRDGAWRPYSGFAKTNAFYAYDDFNPNYSRSMLVVSNPWATVYSCQIISGLISVECKLVDVSLGTTLPFYDKKRDASGRWWYHIETPRGRAIIKESDVVVIRRGIDSIVDVECAVRSGVVKMAKKFIGSPYSWGGCSSWVGHNENPAFDLTNCITGIDCSGLIYLAHKALGLIIPRDAADQYLDSTHIERGACLEVGDLIFLARPIATPERIVQFKINHVLLYCGKDSDGDDLLLESQGILYSKNSAGDYFIAPELVDPPFGCRAIKTKNHLLFKYYNLADICSGQILTVLADDVTLERRVFFGSFLSSEKIAFARRALFASKSLTRYESFLAPSALL